METKGIEPSFPRCDRGVLPLHHVPDYRLSAIIIAASPEAKLFFNFLAANKLRKT